MDSETDIVHCIILKETPAAFLLRDRDDPERQDYFPKSTVSFTRRNVKTGQATAEISLWILNQKGWNS